MNTQQLKKHLFLSSIFILFFSTSFAQWTVINNGLPNTETTGVANVRDTLFTSVKNHGLFYSVNNGDNWSAWKNNARLTTNKITKMEGLTTFPTTGGGLFLHIYGNSMLDFYFSQGEGSILINYNTPNKNINSWVNDDFNDVSYDFIGTNDGVYYSIDDKQTWTKSTGFTGDALIVNDVNIVEYDNESKAIFASTNKGVYKSVDKGVTFSLFTTGISENIVVYNQNLLVTTSNGMYTYDDESDSYTSFVNGGDFRTSVIDYTNLTAYAFGNLTAKKINLQTAAVSDITQTNITGGIINSCTYVKDYLFICTNSGGVFRIATNTLSTGNFTLNKKKFNVYPNPSKGNIKIKTDTVSSFDIYSITGKLVKTIKTNNRNTISLNLNKGVYLIKENKSNSFKKLIIE